MHSKASFWKPFGSESVNESQKLLKSAEKYFYLTFSSIWARLSQKKVFLIRSEILDLLDNMSSANYECSWSNRENLHSAIQINLSEKPSMFSGFFLSIFGMYIKFVMFWKKRSLIGLVFLKLLSPKDDTYLNAYQSLFLKTIW